MQHVVAAQNRLHAKQRQNQQRATAQLRVGNRKPRQQRERRITSQRLGQSAHGITYLLLSLHHHWCTGKDSNLRTSLGGTDLQSVGFNHSPTCAKTLGRCGCLAHRPTPQTKRNPPSDSKPRTTFLRTGKPRIAHQTREDHYTPENVRRVSVGKTCYAAIKPAACRNSSLRCHYWSWRRDLNPRPPDYKSGALPTELRQQF
jgi:hypothetical protein